MRGGYKILDLKHQTLSTASTGTTITGIYDFLESAQKPVLLEGVTIGTTEHNVPAFVNAYLNASAKYVFTAYGKTWTIDDDDKIVLS